MADTALLTLVDIEDVEDTRLERIAACTDKA
jgi:hypothetical protein